MLSGSRRLTLAPPDSAEVARRLVSQLLRDGYQQGDRLPSERQLGHDLGVGRSVVREALRSLSLLGIIDLRPGAGTYLRQVADEPVSKASELGRLLSTRRIGDLATVSLHLETVMAGFAAERRGDPALTELDRLHAELASGRDLPATIDIERRYHAGVWSAASNHVLAEILASVRALLDAPLADAIGGAADRRWIVEDHALVTEAIRYREADTARAVMTAHMARIEERLRAAGGR